jgi:hypothetical protein
MKRHPMLAKGLTIAALIVAAVTVAVFLLYWTGLAR